MKAPPYPLEGVVSWNMNTTCNYRCTYCTQRFSESRARWARDLPLFLAAFARLPGDWEIKLSGGEPFRHPHFLEAVEALAASGLRVSVVTNLSSSDADLARFAAATARKPGVISASLHLEYAEPAAFRDKVLRLAEVHAGSLCVTCVATRENLPRLPELHAMFDGCGISFKIQPEKQDRDVIDYNPAERDALLALGGHGGSGAIDPDLSGQPCWAGARYFIVDHQGEAWRCYPARRYRKESLGNLLTPGFRLRLEPALCPYTYCNCTVPQQRGMVHMTGRTARSVGAAHPPSKEV